MNHYQITINFEETTFKKVINIMANCESDAITEALNKLSDREFDQVENVTVISDKGNIEN